MHGEGYLWRLCPRCGTEAVAGVVILEPRASPSNTQILPQIFPHIFPIFQTFTYFHISPNISNSRRTPQIFSQVCLNLLTSNVFLKYSPKNLRILFQVLLVSKHSNIFRYIVSIIFDFLNIWIYPQTFIKFSNSSNTDIVS